jgi:AcrR family transcriptional regulator
MSAKRDSIITTAMRLFNQYGFTNIGIDRIIDESGVAKMTFYKHFPSKNQLIQQCLSLIHI